MATMKTYPLLSKIDQPADQLVIDRHIVAANVQLDSAPAFFAASNVFKAYCGLAAYPSKKCSASYTTSRPFDFKKPTVSAISSRFSSRCGMQTGNNGRSSSC